MVRRQLTSCARAWCLFPHGRERRLVSWLRQLLILALAYLIGEAAGRRHLARKYDISYAPRSYPGNLTQIFPDKLVVRTLEQDVKAAGGRWSTSRRGGSMRRVLFLTYEIAGPHMNGGIGTAFRNLAESLASRGHNVSVVVVTGAQSNPNSGRTWQQWVDVFREKYSVSLSALGNYPKHWDDTPTKYSYDLKKARQTYEWMLPRENDWDIIHFHEWRGLGYYITESKRLGLRFLDSLLVTGTHGPDLWAHMASLKMPELKNVEPGFLERKAIERADVVISPSLYMLKWINDEMRWPVANRLVVIPNVLGSAFSGAGPRSAAKVKAKEFVFFGRLEIRKGFSVFKDAMLELIKESSNPPKITMIGKAESESLISSLPKDWTAFTNFSIEAAHRYLKGGEGRIAVVPSLVDNSPYTILECLAAGVPLIASAAGGNAELFHPDFRETNMFRPDVKPLLKIAKDAMEKGVPVAYPALEPGEVHEAWGRWHESVPTTMSPFKGRASISVIAPIEFDEDPSDEHVKDLKECLPSFSGEVVLVHSAVKEPRVKLPPKWKLVKEETGFIPYMFNNATLKATSGEILLFVDFGARPRLDVDLIVKSFGPPKVNMLVVPSYPEGNDTLAFVAIAPQSTGASSLVMGERGIRKGRSLAIRRPTFNKLSGFDEGPNVPETVISLLIKTDVARIPVYQLPDPMPAPIIPPDDPENKELNRTQINYKNRVVYYAALGRYFPQDTGYALIVADQMIDRAKRMRGDSKKEFSLNQGQKSWYYGYREMNPETGEIGNFTLLTTARKVCWNEWDCEERHDMGEGAKLANIFIGDRKQHPMVLYASGESPKVYMAVRAWVARTHGPKEVFVFIKRVPNSTCGDGVIIRLVVDDKLYQTRFMPLDLEDKRFIDDVAEIEVEVPMVIGSTLEVQVDPRKSHDCDGMIVDIEIAEAVNWNY